MTALVEAASAHDDDVHVSQVLVEGHPVLGVELLAGDVLDPVVTAVASAMWPSRLITRRRVIRPVFVGIAPTLAGRGSGLLEVRLVRTG